MSIRNPIRILKNPNISRAEISNINKGDRVFDSYINEIGHVVDISDPHNIQVDFENGNGFYCIVPTCQRFDNTLFKVNSKYLEPAIKHIGATHALGGQTIKEVLTNSIENNGVLDESKRDFDIIKIVFQDNSSVDLYVDTEKNTIKFRRYSPQ